MRPQNGAVPVLNARQLWSTSIAAVRTTVGADAWAGDYVVLDRYGRILDISRSLAATLEFPGERLVGRRLHNRVPASHRSVFMRALNSVHDCRAWVACDFQLRKRTAAAVDVHVTAATFLQEPAGALLLRLAVTATEAVEPRDEVDLRSGLFAIGGSHRETLAVTTPLPIGARAFRTR